MGAGFNVDNDDKYINKNVVIKLRPASELKAHALKIKEENDAKAVNNLYNKILNNMQISANNGMLFSKTESIEIDKVVQMTFELIKEKLIPLGYKVSISIPNNVSSCYNIIIYYN